MNCRAFAPNFVDQYMQGGLPAQIIVNILSEEMAMPANSVWLRQQNKTIPNDDNLYIAVGMISAKTIGNVTEVINLNSEGQPIPLTEIGTSYEVNNLQQQETIQIDIFSSARSNLALRRNWEVVAALQSLYSQQQQELNNFKILRIPRSFVDTSDAEGGSMLQRYSITIVCFVWYRKQKLLGDYYDDFKVEAQTEVSDPAFEFEITPETPSPLEGA